MEEKVKRVIDSFNEFLAKNQDRTRLYGEVLNAFYQRLRLEYLINSGLDIHLVHIEYEDSLKNVTISSNRGDYQDIQRLFNKLLDSKDLDIYPRLEIFIYQIKHYKVC